MPVMQRGLFLFLSFILLIQQCYAYELVLPREKKTTVSSKYIYFMGKANHSETIDINNIPVYVAPNGAFARSVKLKEGENRVVVRSSYNTQIYKIYKKTLKKSSEEKFVECEPRPALVLKDKTILRSAPKNDGVNIISGLFKDTRVIINGSQGQFYRVFLSADTAGWVAKKDVTEEIPSDSVPASFVNMSSQKYKNASVQSISFTQNLPYIVENRDKELVFKVFNPELSENSVYTLNIPKPDKYTYNITLQDGCYTFKVNNLPKTIEECTIVIDAGHGGTEKGAIGCLGDEEKNINLKIALELQQYLKQLGANVILTRECDGNMTLDDRIALAKNNDADIFISIHLNATGDMDVNIRKNRGTSVYYYNDNSSKLAEILEKTITKSAGTRKDGVMQKGFAVLRPSCYTGVLVEAAYMTNPMDSVLYRSEDFAFNVATGIADGILEFLAE